MNDLKKISTVEFADKFLQMTAIFMLVVAMAYALSAVGYLVSEEPANILNRLETGLGILVLVIYLPLFLFMLRKLTRSQRRRCFDSDGYVTHVFNRACGGAFKFTFILLIAMDFITGKYSTGLPTEFFIKLILSLTLAAFTVRFFYLNRSDTDNDLEDEPAV